MNSRQEGFSIPHVLLLIVIGIIVGAGWYVYRTNDPDSKSSNDLSNTTKLNEDADKTNAASQSTDSKLSSDWLLRESSDASIRVPDGFNILVSKGDTVGFVLPDVPQGTLKYQKGKTATIVGEPHKHFELGLIASFNSPGFNDLGTKIREFKTYSGLNVSVKLFEQLKEPVGLSFPMGSKYLNIRSLKEQTILMLTMCLWARESLTS